ncbi:hypothetical protein F5Y15DRAFT_416867 [Xylariaceae sp. FL0016]|nr:hypothetical protein F5Y15DRAFT_416867 [Xylariaceae sp. FL0016]
MSNEMWEDFYNTKQHWYDNDGVQFAIGIAILAAFVLALWGIGHLVNHVREKREKRRDREDLDLERGRSRARRGEAEMPGVLELRNLSPLTLPDPALAQDGQVKMPKPTHPRAGTEGVGRPFMSGGLGDSRADRLDDVQL